MKQNEILLFLASAVVVVFAWIAFTIIHNSLTSTISETTIQAIIPIQPVFDTKTIDALAKRTSITPLFTIPNTSQTAIVVSTAPGATEIATQSSQIASQGGKLQ